MASEHRVASNIYVGLTYDDAAAAIDWLCRSFGFTRRLVVPGPEGSVMHSELSLGDGVIMIGSPRPEQGRHSPKKLGGMTACVSVCVEDPDGHFEHARACGVEIVVGLKDEEYGSRGYMAKDLEGNLWYFGTYRPGAHWE
jgi:uncharacterized glyoxalase superfamily protein PhnB